MLLRPQAEYCVPVETARVAKAVFPNGNIYLTLADSLGAYLSEQDFAHLFAQRGQPAVSPFRLALATIMQYVEGLTDRQTADAVRSRLDWKYLLCLELTDSGFDYTVLSEFRTRLINSQAESLIFEKLLELCRDKGWLKARTRQRSDSTHVLAAIRGMTRVECVGETLRAALNALAVVAPEWLRSSSQTQWIKRYSTRIEEHRQPKSESQKLQLAQTYGEDGMQLLNYVFDNTSPVWLRAVPAVEMLRRVWVQQYYLCDNVLHWRTSEDIPPASVMISSPYEPDAHYAKKYTTSWIGYKVHLTETCESDAPHLITHVETTVAPMADGDVTEQIHAALQAKDLLPDKHIVDTGYLDAELLVTSQQQYGIDLVGPTRLDYRWQAKEGQGFAAVNFFVDWKQKIVTCPEGKTSSSWTPAKDSYGNGVVKIKFAEKDCTACPSQPLCTTRSKQTRRTVTLRLEQQCVALQTARIRETTTQFKQEYARRAGIEGTLSEGVRVHHLRHARYIGLPKTHLQHLMTATAINLKRIFYWLVEKPLAATRTSRFVALMTQPANS